MGQKSSNSLINKILFANQNKKQVFVAFLGVLIGFVFISISVHYLIQLNKKSISTEVLDSNTITVQKQVSTSSTLAIANNTFSKKEIEFYSNLPFVERLISVENNNFPVELKSNDPLIPYFRSDIFIQAIPVDFLDIKSDSWKWKEGDVKVPIILPRDFVYMMNNFLSSSGMPQLSDEILKDVGFQIEIGKFGNHVFNAKIIGFTNEISSILVPQSFMHYGSQYFGDRSSEKYTQLMLKSKRGQFGLLQDIIDKNHLEVKKNQIVEGKLKSMLTIILSSVTFISLIIVLLAMIVLIQFLQLLITKNSYEIRTMLRLGVSVNNVVFQFIKYVFVRFVFVIIIIALLDFFLFKNLNKLLISAGFTLDFDDYSNVIVILSVIFTLVFFSTVLSVNKFVKKEF